MAEMKKKILVVEDDEELTHLLHKRIVLAGFDVRVVPDALLGVQELRQFRPDLVILDLMLPAGGGLKVLEAMKTSIYSAYTPVLVISGMERQSQPGMFERMEKMGISGFLKKPFEGNLLVEEIRKILREQGQDSEER